MSGLGRGRFPGSTGGGDGVSPPSQDHRVLAAGAELAVPPPPPQPQARAAGTGCR